MGHPNGWRAEQPSCWAACPVQYGRQVTPAAWCYLRSCNAVPPCMAMFLTQPSLAIACLNIPHYRMPFARALQFRAIACLSPSPPLHGALLHLKIELARTQEQKVGKDLAQAWFRATRCGAEGLPSTAGQRMCSSTRRSCSAAPCAACLALRRRGAWRVVRAV